MAKRVRAKISRFFKTLEKIYAALQVKSIDEVIDRFFKKDDPNLFSALSLVHRSFDTNNKNLLLRNSLVLANILTPFLENEDWYEIYLSLDKDVSPVYFDLKNPKCNFGHVNLNFYVIRSEILTNIGKIINRFVKRATPRMVLPNVDYYRLTGCFWLHTDKNAITLPTSKFLADKNKIIQEPEYKDMLFSMPEDFIPILLPKVKGE